MKSLLVLTTILAALLFATGCTKASTKRAFLYASNQDRADFVSAFATEPACNGVTLDTTLGDEPRLHYNGNATQNMPFPPRYFGYIVTNDVPSADIDFEGDTVQAAVRQACGILTHKGGTFGGAR